MNGVIKRDLDNPYGKMPTTFNGYQYVTEGNLLMCLFDIDVTPRCIGLIEDSGVDWIGLMPKEWGHSSVGRGASPRPAEDPLYFNGQDVPWITVAEVTNGEGKYIDSTETYLTIEGSKKVE